MSEIINFSNSISKILKTHQNLDGNKTFGLKRKVKMWRTQAKENSGLTLGQISVYNIKTVDHCLYCWKELGEKNTRFE